MSKSTGSNNLQSIEFDVEKYFDRTPRETALTMLTELGAERERNYGFYLGRVRANSFWANRINTILSLCGVLAALATTAAAFVRFYYSDSTESTKLDIYILAVALFFYALMGAIYLFEKGTQRVSKYHRALGVLIHLKGLWSEFNFDVIRETSVVHPAGSNEERASRDRLLALGKAFADEVNKASSEEVETWSTERREAMARLAEIAEQGTSATETAIERAIEKLNTATTAADEAAAAATAARQPAILNITVTGDVEGDVVVRVDEAERKKTHLRSFPLRAVEPGLRVIDAEGRSKGGVVRQAAFVHDAKPGIQDVEIALI